MEIKIKFWVLTSIGKSVSRARAVALNVWFQTDSPKNKKKIITFREC